MAVPTDLPQIPGSAPVQEGRFVTSPWLQFFIRLLKWVESLAVLVTADVLVGTTSPELANGRVVTNTATVTWDLTTPLQAKANAVISVPTVIQVLTADPVAPADDTAWLFRDTGVTPNNLDWHVRKGGVTVTFPIGTFP